MTIKIKNNIEQRQIQLLHNKQPDFIVQKDTLENHNSHGGAAYVNISTSETLQTNISPVNNPNTSIGEKH
ncbi:hypothetical protein DPMN_052014 [Dreissena polymorpha]|uniref:Uncharacterized protein n=1 Tax=Dreissena polymorpha TaxID=45954 RepID=A0A9D4CKM3_DREPO|nr:hypothetical protein DPMN_052014 [Dreissena polymorpha]